MESAIISLETKDPFIPSVPIEIASDTVIVPNSNGVPFEELMPCLTSLTNGLIPELQGVTSLWVEATPIKGAFISLSSKPIALIIDLCGALATPSVVSQLLHFPFCLSSFFLFIFSSTFCIDSINLFYNYLVYNAIVGIRVYYFKKL